MYTKILIATDGSDYTKKATAHAIELAKLCGAELHAIYVIDTRYGCGPESCILTDTSPERLKSILGCQGDTAIKYIEKLAKKEGIHTERWIVEGNPAEEIVRLAEEQSDDMIVMGTLGSSGIERFVLGSVADKVIRNSRIPVLTVRKWVKVIREKTMPKDPVCGMYVDEKTAIKKEIGGRTYYFCMESCLKTFENPERELKSMKRRVTIALSGVLLLAALRVH